MLLLKFIILKITKAKLKKKKKSYKNVYKIFNSVVN